MSKDPGSGSASRSKPPGHGVPERFLGAAAAREAARHGCSRARLWPLWRRFGPDGGCARASGRCARTAASGREPPAVLGRRSRPAGREHRGRWRWRACRARCNEVSSRREPPPAAPGGAARRCRTPHARRQLLPGRHHRGSSGQHRTRSPAAPAPAGAARAAPPPPGTIRSTPGTPADRRPAARASARVRPRSASRSRAAATPLPPLRPSAGTRRARPASGSQPSGATSHSRPAT